MGRRARSSPKRDRLGKAGDPLTLIQNGGSHGGVPLAHAEAMRARIAGFGRLLKKWTGGPGGTRTPDLRFRKALLYPAELPGLAGRSDATGGGRRQVRKGR